MGRKENADRPSGLMADASSSGPGSNPVAIYDASEREIMLLCRCSTSSRPGSQLFATHRSSSARGDSATVLMEDALT